MARKKLDTLSEQMYYVLLALVHERHGYGIMQYIRELTRERVSIGAGTLYGLLSRFEREGLIRQTKETESRKYYILTSAGLAVLRTEMSRLCQQAADGIRVFEEDEQREEEA